MSLSVMLTHAIVIQNPTDGALDEYSNPTVTWVDTAAQAFVQPINKRELESGNTVLGTHVAFLYPAAAITERSRIVYDGVTYDVIGVEVFRTPAEVHHKVAIMVAGS